MTPPIRHLQNEWIPEHPALQRFVQFVEERKGASPPTERILVKNGQAQDGFIDLQYVSPDGNIFLGRLNAHEQLLQLHHGKVLKGKGQPDWGQGAVEVHLPNTCRTLHFLGGEQESEVRCQDVLSTPPTSNRALWYTGMGMAAWSGAELLSRRLRNRSFTLGLWKELHGGLRISPPQTSAFRHLLREWPAAGLGFLAMHAAGPISDALHLHPRDEKHERWSLAVGSGYLTYRATRGIFNRGKRKITTDPAHLGTSLMSAALLDLSLGRFWKEGSWERRMVRETGFFLPAMLQGLQRDRQLALFQKAGLPSFGRKWGRRVLVAGFLADAGYLAYRHLAHGSVAAVLQNRLYARANQLHDLEIHPVTALVKGAASFLAPALTERFFVPDAYVQKAADEMKHQDLRYISSIEDTLRYWTLQVSRDAEEFSDSEADWKWLREENKLEDVRKPDGRVLPVAAIAEQLSDPKVGAKLEGKAEAEVIRYVQHQFRGYRLTETEAREVLQRIVLYQTRQWIVASQPGSDPELRSLLSHFDAEGRLLPGHGPALRSRLFADPTLAFRS